VKCQPKAAKNGAFATVHGINETDASSVPSLGPGQLLTTRFLESLKQSLRTEPRSVLLPANVLAYTSDLLIWWTGPRLHPMYFSEGAEDRAAVHGKACPHPSLIWKVRRGRLSLRALGSNVRPSPETELMVAPYWNTEARTGSVCEGGIQLHEFFLELMLHFFRQTLCDLLVYGQFADAQRVSTYGLVRPPISRAHQTV
jgi:PRTRC genetic system protein B